MKSYFLKSASTDICFCESQCKNKQCDRNKNGDLFVRNLPELMYYAVSDFSDSCSDYKGKKPET